MIIKLDQLKRDPGEYESFDFGAEPLPEDNGYELLTPIHAVGTVTFGGNQFLLSGSLDARVRMPCSRCLCVVEEDVAIDFDEEYDEVEFDREDPVIDVGEIAAQIWSASIPMSVLCDEDCKGLCAQCGANLNEGECCCPPEDIDPRLEILRKLKDK